MIKGGRLVLALVLLILYPMTPLLLKLYDPNPDAVRMIYLMLTIGVVPLPLIWCNAYVTSTTMNSAGDVKYSTYASLLSMLLCRVALGYVLTIVLNLGPVGIWLGMLVEWLLRMVLVEKRFKSGKWMRHVVHKGEAAAAG
jgi:Na+-driven multidrug efflux pump